MTWTYLGLPGTTTAIQRRDSVRLYVGDKNVDDQQVSDEEIAFALSESSDDIYAASAMICRILIGKYSRDVDIGIESVRKSASQRVKNYTQLAERYEQQASTRGGGLGTPYVGGISESTIDAVDDDSDRVKPAFKRGQFNNPPESDFDDLSGAG